MSEESASSTSTRRVSFTRPTAALATSRSSAIAAALRREDHRQWVAQVLARNCQGECEIRESPLCDASCCHPDVYCGGMATHMCIACKVRRRLERWAARGGRLRDVLPLPAPVALMLI